MNNRDSVQVTISIPADTYGHLCEEAEDYGIPVETLIANKASA